MNVTALAIIHRDYVHGVEAKVCVALKKLIGMIPVMDVMETSVAKPDMNVFLSQVYSWRHSFLAIRFQTSHYIEIKSTYYELSD